MKSVLSAAFPALASLPRRRSVGRLAGFACGMAFSGLVVIATLAAVHAATVAPPSLAICANQSVPAGYAITAYSRTPACGPGVGPWNTMTITPYTGQKTFSACAPFPNIPAGYLITALRTTTPCRGGQGALTAWNTMTLTAYSGLRSLKVCAPLPNVPSGYLVTGQSTTTTCKGGQAGAAWNTVTLTAYQALATVNACMPLPTIPSGYVVTARIRTNLCAGPPGPNTVTLKRLAAAGVQAGKK